LLLTVALVGTVLVDALLGNRAERKRLVIRGVAIRSARVVEDVSAAADALGLSRAGLVESPITGSEGNREFLLHLRP